MFLGANLKSSCQKFEYSILWHKNETLCSVFYFFYQASVHMMTDLLLLILVICSYQFNLCDKNIFSLTEATDLTAAQHRTTIKDGLIIVQALLLALFIAALLMQKRNLVRNSMSQNMSTKLYLFFWKNDKKNGFIFLNSLKRRIANMRCLKMTTSIRLVVSQHL